ncbi:MAG: type VI secretion system contractile sheath large subunit, partial [Gammaproteobacteria bacterium]|nr:type VI secretion system contractile sheath large subunit [Gammaproteobacteria bacterium]
MPQLTYSEIPDCTDNSEILESIIDQFLDGQKSANIFNDLLKHWLEELTKNNQLIKKQQIKASIQWIINNIDELINENINLIIHSEKFKKLEASWNGLYYLVKECNYNKRVKIKFYDISWKEVSKDISKAIEFDQSTLFSKIYSEEYGLPGGEPYGVILGDYEVSHQANKDHPYDDIATLEGMAAICAAAFSPFISAATPELFG